MRSPTSFSRSGYNQRPFTRSIVLLLSTLFLILSGCADEKVDDAADCQSQLDNYQFQEVADNAACSNYERGSAELGLAGFLFENFLKEDASNNFASALNLTSTGCSTSGTDALTGAYNSSYQQRFMRAQYWARTKANADSTTRSNGEVEISYFATLGEIIGQTHCEIDTNLDGTISDAENNAFTKINIGGSAVGTSELDSATDQYLIIASGIPWLCDTAPGEPDCRQDVDYEGVWESLGADATTDRDTLFVTLTSGDTVSAIIKVDNLQQLFDPDATTADINEPYQFLDTYTNRANLLLTDLTALGVSESDDLYDNVKESVGKMDNGGTCTNSSVQVLSLLTTIVQKAAPQSTAGDLPTSNYRDYNLLNTSDISQIDTGESPLTCAFCPAGVTFNARLIYNITGTSYTGLYKTARSEIKDTLSKLATLTLDSDNNLIPIVANDEKITLKELLCLDE